MWLWYSFEQDISRVLGDRSLLQLLVDATGHADHCKDE